MLEEPCQHIPSILYSSLRHYHQWSLQVAAREIPMSPTSGCRWWKFPSSLRNLHTWNFHTMLFENYWATFSLSGKATQRDWETRDCVQKCLSTGAELDLLVNGCTTGFRGPGESQTVCLKAALDKIAAQAATSSPWGGPTNIQCCAACLPSPEV